MKTKKEKIEVLQITDDISMSSDENEYFHYIQVVKSKNDDGFVVIVTALGTQKFKQSIVDALRHFRFDDENNNHIYGIDIHGKDVLQPNYEPYECEHSSIK